MIETRLLRVECAFVLGRLGLEPLALSPLADYLASAAVPPQGSPAEAGLVSGLHAKGLGALDGTPNPYLATALEWLAAPERVLCLTQFGPGGVETVHLVVARGVAVECRRHTDDLVLRFPLPEAELHAWLTLRTVGGSAS
jgi:hypothetical protein